MSTIVRAKFKCPHCGKEFEADMYKGVVVSEDIKYRSMLINNDYFKYTCPHCNKNLIAVYPLLYTDPVNKFMIQFTPNEFYDEMQKLLETNRSNFPKDFTIRLVRATYDAIEKMLIFENRFDDRPIECSKVLIHKAFLEKYPGKQVHHIYFNVNKDGNFFYDVLINGEENKEEVMRASFDVQLYNRLYKDFRREYSDDDLAVDYKYGLEHMKNGPKHPANESEQVNNANNN